MPSRLGQSICTWLGRELCITLRADKSRLDSFLDCNSWRQYFRLRLFRLSTQQSDTWYSITPSATIPCTQTKENRKWTVVRKSLEIVHHDHGRRLHDCARASEKFNALRWLLSQSHRLFLKSSSCFILVKSMFLCTPIAKGNCIALPILHQIFGKLVTSIGNTRTAHSSSDFTWSEAGAREISWSPCNSLLSMRAGWFVPVLLCALTSIHQIIESWELDGDEFDNFIVNWRDSWWVNELNIWQIVCHDILISGIIFCHYPLRIDTSMSRI
jgi:hypothetical protein